MFPEDSFQRKNMTKIIFFIKLKKKNGLWLLMNYIMIEGVQSLLPWIPQKQTKQYHRHHKTLFQRDKEQEKR